jgi:hypothetical protein
MYAFKSGFARFSEPVCFAVLGEYPALIAASVALPLIRYSSQNFRCLGVTGIHPFHQA